MEVWKSKMFVCEWAVQILTHNQHVCPDSHSDTVLFESGTKLNCLAAYFTWCVIYLASSKHSCCSALLCGLWAFNLLEQHKTFCAVAISLTQAWVMVLGLLKISLENKNTHTQKSTTVDSHRFIFVWKLNYNGSCTFHFSSLFKISGTTVWEPWHHVDFVFVPVGFLFPTMWL